MGRLALAAPPPAEDPNKFVGYEVGKRSNGVTTWDEQVLFPLTTAQRKGMLLAGTEASNILLRGGSRSGKTFLFVLCIVCRALAAPGSRHAIWRYRFNHVKTSVWYDTLPKVMKLCFPKVRLKDNKTDGFTRFPNGSEIWFGGLDEKERVEKVLGNEYATVYFNEVSQIPYDSVIVGLTRLAQNVDVIGVDGKFLRKLGLKAYYDCNPPGKSHWTYQQWMLERRPGTQERLAHPDRYVQMLVNPRDNLANLPAEYVESLEDLPPRQRLRFLSGEWSSEVDGALWTLEGIDRDRIAIEDCPVLARKVVAVDPAVTSGPDADETGIIVAGMVPRGDEEHVYIEADYTMKGGPTQWARQAIAAYHAHECDYIVAEVNNGGELVESVLNAVDPNVKVKMVHASRGKVTRAEPVANLYDKGRVHHLGTLPALEEQMSEFTAGFIREKGMPSPDRVDALVWAVSDLLFKPPSGVIVVKR
jgi:hypothetical protein